MRLRTKIFLLVGGLFFVAFLTSQVLEEYLTSKNLRFEGSLIEEQVLEHQEGTRLNLERFSKSLIERRNNQIDVLFNKIHAYNWLSARFSPSQANYEEQTWLPSASLLLENKWMDFIENSNEGKIVSQIVIDRSTPNLAIQVPHDEHFSYILVREDVRRHDWNRPLIGIPYRFEKTGTFSNFYSLFSPKAIKNMDLDKITEKVNSLKYDDFPSELHLDEAKTYKQVILDLVNSLKVAQKYFNENPQKFQEIVGPHIPQWLEQRVPNLERQCGLAEKGLTDQSGAASISMRFDKISMVWQICSLLGSQALAKEPFSSNFPVGMAQIPAQMGCGQAILNGQLFYDVPQITSRQTLSVGSVYGNEREYAKIIFTDKEGRLFFGSSTTFKEAKRTGSLTIGVDMRHIIKNLALATSTDTFFVSGEKVLAGFNPLGKEIIGDGLSIPIKRMGSKKSGFFSFDGTEYFFMKLKPYRGFGLNFYLVAPKNQMFALSMSISENAKTLIDKITLQMQIIAFAALLLVLFVLNHIARHVTNPITHLARACHILGEGHLDEVNLPKLKTKAKDEIHVLYKAFDGMIQGLKEKDKVQGVLNKVVSPSIANEILKGKIHLGGEEKVVTVLFADIRSFTKISEKMPPHILIDMLNTCMTKISNTIDAHGGVIDKYVGDEVMALFGAPIEDQESGYKAVECAFDILRVLDDWNAQRAKEHLPIIEMGIGIHTGNMIVGNMGAENRLNYTVLGANVNLASRLCAAAEPSQILISHHTLKTPQVEEKFETKQLDKMMLKGFSQPIDTYQVVRPRDIDQLKPVTEIDPSS